MGDVYLIEEIYGCTVMSIMQWKSTTVKILHYFIMATGHAKYEKIYSNMVSVILFGVFQ